MAGSRRFIYLSCVVATVALGLLVRWPGLGLPAFAAKYLGSAVWGALVYWLVALMVPRARIVVVIVVAAVVAAAVETSQLVHLPWLDQFRRSTIGGLLLGRVFALADIAAYWLGIAAAGAADQAAVRRWSGRASRTAAVATGSSQPSGFAATARPAPPGD